jgi:hypothetical protein
MERYPIPLRTMIRMRRYPIQIRIQNRIRIQNLLLHQRGQFRNEVDLD